MNPANRIIKMHFKNLSIEKESSRFKDHLTLEDNNRIILSGIFGIGKTYFINKFFENHKKEFIEIKLNPVNYSVSQNEDIFELIKFDIGFQLFKENPDFDKVEIDNILATEFFFRQNYKELIKTLASILSKIDHRINSIVKPILELKEKIENFKEENQVDEEKELMTFLEDFKLKKGTFREENSVTELINILIDTLKANQPEKKIVLIIDDLDRIDPEHIFRILNVFSAHFDYYQLGDENKFGFDKVVLICDIDNIRSIFHNRYGTDIDFSGYIDKFYSLEVFNYDFRKIIIESLQSFFKSINSDNNILVGYIINNQDNYYTKELSFLLEYFIKSNVLSMRALINFLKIRYSPADNVIKTRSSYKVYTIDTPIILIFDILTVLFGGINNLKLAVAKTNNRFPIIELSTYNNYWNQRLGNLIMLIGANSNDLQPNRELIEFIDTDLDLKVIYEILPSGNGISGKAKQIGPHKQDSELIDLNTPVNFKIKYFQILEKALQSYTSLPIESVN